MNHKKVLIIILNYNRFNDTCECLDSLRLINYTNYELLIIDNCSTDKSFENLKNKYNNINIIQTKSNLGYTGGINFGFNIAKSNSAEYVLLLNNDTIVRPDFLNHLVKSLENEKKFVISTGTILCEHDKKKIWYAGGKMIHWRGLAIHLEKNKDFIKEKPLIAKETEFISGCMMLVRKDFFNSGEFLDANYYMYLDDIELSLRVRASGGKLVYVPSSIIYHKVLDEEINPFKLYYSIRNRKLLITNSLPSFYKIFAFAYFYFVIKLKKIIWFFKNKKFYEVAVVALEDYKEKNFGAGRGHNYLKNYDN